MTSRRALQNGTRASRLLAVLRRNSGSAALVVAGGLLLSACSVRCASAATHVTHTHRSSAPISAGRAEAHVVHDEDIHASRSAGRKDHHAAESASRSRHSSPARKGADSSRKTRDSEDSRHTAKAPAKGSPGRRRHQEEPVDDPVPVRRADVHHGRQDMPRETLHGKKREQETEEASMRRAPAWNPHPGELLRGAVRSSSLRESAGETVSEEREPAIPANVSTVLPVRNGTPGNVARNMARRASQGHPASAPPAVSPGAGPSTENLTGVSEPDDDERLPMRSAVPPSSLPNAARRQATIAAFARPSAALPTISAPSTLPTQPNTGVVEGFGSEVDLHPATVQLANRPAPVAAPRGTAAQQAQELREAAEAASKPMFVPLYNRDGKLVVPPPLKGSRDILVHQNQMADDAGLTRIQDDADLDRMRRAHLLVELEDSASLHVNEGLPENRRAARPWTVHFANDIANAFYSRFGEALQLNSAVRTVAYQLRLQRTNGNAAAVDGEGASPHLTGQAIDFGKRGMNMAQIAWMRSYLMPLIDAGKIDVEEEFQQACFHISVYASYVPAHKRAPAITELAQAPRPTHSRSATAEYDDNDMR